MFDCGFELVVCFEGIMVEYLGMCVFDDVDFCLFVGEVYVVMGENVVGKLIFVGVIMGIYVLQVGIVFVDGVLCWFLGVVDSCVVGIVMVFQEVQLSLNLSVVENVMFGCECWGCFGIDWWCIRVDVVEVFVRLGFDDFDLKMLLLQFIFVQKQFVVFVCVVVDELGVLVFDEFILSLDVVEVVMLMCVIWGFCQWGVVILFVLYFLEQVFVISDCMIVLCGGYLVGEYVMCDLDCVDLILKMFGKDIDSFRVFGLECKVYYYLFVGQFVLQVLDVGWCGELEQMDFEIQCGEIVGFVGL